MVFINFVIWWYSKGISELISFLGNLFLYISNYFSIKEILFSFFSPWKRFVAERRPGLDGLRDWMLDNIISRLVGMIMRIFIIIIYIFSIILYITFSITFFFLWVFMPFLLFYSIYLIFGGVQWNH